MHKVLSLSFVFLILCVSGMAANPYPEIDRNLDEKFAIEIAPSLAKQLQEEFQKNLHKSLDVKVKVLKSFKFEKWTILYVDTRVSDEDYLFFSGDPRNSKYVTSWSGMAEKNDAQLIKNWVLKDAPGIPKRLLEFFVWYVTEGGG